LFAVGSHIERTKESGSTVAAEATGASSAPAGESASQRRSEAGAKVGGTPRLSRASAPSGETHREARSGSAPHAETRTGGSEGAPAASVEPNAGETAAHLKSESHAAAGTASATTMRENVSERRAEKRREAKLLGVNPEALSLVIIAVIVSVLLAAAIWFRRITLVLVAIAVFGLVFAALDVREVLHQVDESRTNLIVIAGVLIGLHLLVAGLAAVGLLAGPARRRPTADDRSPLAV
jgi:hypothetical protein